MQLRMTLLAAVALAVLAPVAQAQRFGVQLSLAEETDLGFGGRMEIGMPGKFAPTGPFSKARFVGSFDFYPDCGTDCTYFEINPGVVVPLPATTVSPYVGAGLNVAHASAGGASNTEMGVNLIGGLRFGLGGLSALTEARLALGGGEQFIISFGILFGR